jgi:hypothetical protein
MPGYKELIASLTARQIRYNLLQQEVVVSDLQISQTNTHGDCWSLDFLPGVQGTN